MREKTEEPLTNKLKGEHKFNKKTGTAIDKLISSEDCQEYSENFYSKNQNNLEKSKFLETYNLPN